MEKREYDPTVLAVKILDEKKREVVAKDIGAWMILFHAKQYLLGKDPSGYPGEPHITER